MNKVWRLAAVATVVGMIGAAGAAYAATAKTPAEVAAEVTGQTVETVQAERADGKSYGTIADEAGKLEEFKSQMLEQRKVYLEERVQEGTLTQEQADLMLERMADNQLNCDGAGNGQAMKGQAGARMGRGMGMGQGKGMGQGNGQRMGNGMGQGNGQGGGMFR